MKRELIVQLHASFEEMVHVEEEAGVEFWLARDLQEVLGYDTWRRSEDVIERAVTACENAGYDPGDHFVRVGKMVPLGSGAQREVDDYALTRYACYLIAQNGDPAKEPIAFAQTYFAIQTRKQELIEQLPPSEDIKKVERRVASEQKKLPKQVKPLESLEDESDG